MPNRAGRRAAAREQARTERRQRHRLRRGATALAGASMVVAGTAGALAGSGAPAGALAPGIVVNSLADTSDGTCDVTDCTLREALAVAGDTDTVTFSVSGTITFGSSISMTTRPTIDGGNTITLSGGGTKKGLELDSISGVETLTLKNITFDHFKGTSGAALDVRNAPSTDVVLDHVTMTYNTLGKISPFTGPAVYLVGVHDLTITGSTFDHNFSQYGHNQFFGYGAGVTAAQVHDVTVTDSTFSNNSAEAGAGALYVNGAHALTVTGTTFDHNSSGVGGGLTVTYVNSTTIGDDTDPTQFLYNDVLYSGGAINLYGIGNGPTPGPAAPQTATADASAMTRRVHRPKAGAPVTAPATAPATPHGASTGLRRPAPKTATTPFSSDTEVLSITGVTFANNSAGGTGGAIANVGGPKTLDQGLITITGSTFTDDHALYGGGAVFDVFVDLQIVDSSFTGEVADVSGGAIRTNGADATRDPLDLGVYGSTFSGNSAGGSGGAIAEGSLYGSSVTVANSTFSGNHVPTGGPEGGAIWAGAGTSDVSVTESTFAGNYGGEASVFLVPPAVGTQTMHVSGVLFADDSGESYAVGAYLPTAGSLTLYSVASVLTEPVLPAIDDHLDADTQTGVALADLHLGTLADNGGPTKTIELGTGSLAIDAGPDPVPSFTGDSYDQRGTGFDRVSGGQADVGAFEVQVSVPAPTNLVLAGAGGRSATLTWDAPLSGPTPTGYQIRCMPVGYPTDLGPGGKVVYVGSATTSVTVSDLVGGETYVCYVRARYGAQYFSWLGDTDEGPLSDPSNSIVVARTKPPVPTQVRASAPSQPTGQSTAVSFVEPENRSGAAVSRYDARCASGDGGTTRTGSASASPVGVTNLTKGRTYSCVVSAVNSVGASSWSAASGRIVVPAGPVTGVRASATASRTTVTFTRPDGGPTPSRYWVECRSSDGGTTRTGSEVRAPVVLTGLTRGKTYTCRVWALFDGGARGPVSVPSTAFRIP